MTLAHRPDTAMHARRWEHAVPQSGRWSWTAISSDICFVEWVKPHPDGVKKHPHIHILPHAHSLICFL